MRSPQADRIGRRHRDAAGAFHSLFLKSDGTLWAWAVMNGQSWSAFRPFLSPHSTTGVAGSLWLQGTCLVGRILITWSQSTNLTLPPSQWSSSEPRSNGSRVR